MIFCCSGLIYVVLQAELLFAIKFDENWKNMWLKGTGNTKRNLSLAAFSMLSGLCVSSVLQLQGEDNWKQLLLCIIGASFLMAAITDYATCNVYRFVWWITWAAGLGLLLQAAFTETGGITFPLTALLTASEGIYRLHVKELLIFCLLQESVFDKLYGKADCHGFCAGALIICSFGGDIKEFLLYMAVAFGLLFAVQAFKGNINRRGNLKIPVAFMPYITAAFWGVLLAQCLFP